MDLSDTGGAITLLSGLLIAIGAIGVMLPVLPGLLLSWSGVLLWALLGDGSAAVRWAVLGVATLIAGAGLVIKFLWPGKKLKTTGVPNSALLAGGVLGLIGFFVVPVIGLVLGFVLGVWLVEVNRLGSARAWPSTRSAIAAVGLSLLVELAAALAIAITWVIGLLAA
ncbi:hypothetical protein AMIS_64250 [Actinoplanes missouriensis 431]|uniref:DUF456 domain-containing protein n=1 Tax=Actinoplanes missouriensis (strain ATCC 14538 / DSM 43046 / CBS 188.64 / JCM 3121 / NBRC 102363 / NCIMB 12654 / NRRL B-3342 / UNCC 431) TaxID=512565 RepID=I0HF58_ACTM4|nr:DUF456 domain-containing protein [Actinoplanes missouriensis]BAL91645.1 hypothetical protein AMIS_64250 [Actinoplanes missouriensis 431]